jgi:hypothetical protein
MKNSLLVKINCDKIIGKAPYIGKYYKNKANTQFNCNKIEIKVK